MPGSGWGAAADRLGPRDPDVHTTKRHRLRVGRAPQRLPDRPARHRPLGLRIGASFYRPFFKMLAFHSTSVFHVGLADSNTPDAIDGHDAIVANPDVAVNAPWS